MCGIFGALALQPYLKVDPQLVSRAIELLSHRGPDGSGILETGKHVLGHVRLSIIDLARGVQPMQSFNGDVSISYNGELYNHKALRHELEVLGYKFITDSDTEVALYSYAEWGDECVEKFRGMFAFCAIDLKKNIAILSRDRLGQKPLFYTVQAGILYFSSELEPMYKTVGPFEMDVESLDECLAWQYIPAPRTIYKNVVCLQPAHSVKINLDTGDVHTNRYWDISFSEDGSLTPEEWAESIDSKLRESVAIRLMSDVPFGAFLSGGTDSSLIVGHMSELMNLPVETFAIGFKEHAYNELEYAAKAADICATKHRYEQVFDDPFGFLPIVSKHFGQPFADSSAIPTHQVSRLASQHVKMVLSGDGGDESFAGYNTYEAVLKAWRRISSGRPYKRDFIYRLRSLILRISGKYKPTIEQSGTSLISLRSGVYQHFNFEHRQELFRPGHSEFVEDRLQFHQTILNDESTPLVSRLQNLDMMTYLPGDILTKVDAMSMANSLEVRSPFLDHELIELAARMPVREKLKIDPNGEYNKKDILQRLALRKFPKEIIERPKRGFGVPLGPWFDGPLRSELRRRLLNSEYLNTYFNRDVIKSILDLHSAKTDCSAKIWNLLVIDDWMKSHAAAIKD